MPDKKDRLGLSLAAMAGLVLSACGAPQQPIIQTQVVTQMVEGTPVERIVEVTPTPIPAASTRTSTRPPASITFSRGGGSSA